jgi:hypothetical protein
MLLAKKDWVLFLFVNYTWPGLVPGGANAGCNIAAFVWPIEKEEAKEAHSDKYWLSEGMTDLVAKCGDDEDGEG